MKFEIFTRLPSITRSVRFTRFTRIIKKYPQMCHCHTVARQNVPEKPVGKMSHYDPTPANLYLILSVHHNARRATLHKATMVTLQKTIKLSQFCFCIYVFWNIAPVLRECKADKSVSLYFCAFVFSEQSKAECRVLSSRDRAHQSFFDRCRHHPLSSPKPLPLLLLSYKPCKYLTLIWPKPSYTVLSFFSFPTQVTSSFYCPERQI